MGLTQILRPHRGRQSINIVIGLSDHIIHIREGFHTDHGAKDFLLDHLHGGVGVDQHGRFHKIAFAPQPLAACHGFSPLGES